MTSDAQDKTISELMGYPEVDRIQANVNEGLLVAVVSTEHDAGEMALIGDDGNIVFALGRVTEHAQLMQRTGGEETDFSRALLGR